LLTNIAISINIECDYGIFDSSHAYGDKYRCLVKNDIKIILPEDVYIESVIGTHNGGKTNDNDIHFHISSKSVQYFPRGMEKFFKNLKGIVIWHTQLKEIHQEDLKPYRNLNNLYLSGNDIEIIEDGLFDYNPDIEVIIFENTKLFHISPTVFNNLTKLITLFFNGNVCTKLLSIRDRATTSNVISGVKKSCISSEFLNLMKKLENLEEMTKISVLRNSQGFSQNFINFQTEFKDSKFPTFSPLKEKYEKFITTLTKSTYDDSCDNGVNIVKNLKFKIEQDIEDSQANILSAVDSKIKDLEDRLTRKIEDVDEKLEKVMTNLKKIVTMM
jgi:hypothetical protein